MSKECMSFKHPIHVSQMSVSQMVSHPLPKHTHIKVTLINMAGPAGSSAIVITAVCCI